MGKTMLIRGLLPGLLTGLLAGLLALSACTAGNRQDAGGQALRNGTASPTGSDCSAAGENAIATTNSQRYGCKDIPSPADH